MGGYALFLLIFLSFVFSGYGLNLAWASSPTDSQKKSGTASTEECTTTIRSGKAFDIQRALNKAQSNGKDDVICIEGTYRVARNLRYVLNKGSADCSKKLTIKSVGSGAVLGGTGDYQILSIEILCDSGAKSGEINIENMTFEPVYSAKGTGSIYIKVGNAYSGKIALINNTFNRFGNLFISSYSAQIQVILIGNTFNESSNYQGKSVRAYLDSGAVTLINNTFSGNTNGAVYLSLLSGSVALINNTFSGNTNSEGGAVYLSISGSATLINNTFSNNTADTGGAVYLDISSGSAVLTNNTFSKNTAKRLGGGVYVSLKDDASVNLYNNIFWNNEVAPGDSEDDDSEVDSRKGDDLYVENDGDSNGIASPVNMAHNLFSVSQRTINFSEAPQGKKVFIKVPKSYNLNIPRGCIDRGNYGNIQADPMFINAQKGDFRLQPNSPAIDKGCNRAPGLSQIQKDKDGNPRVMGSVVDMGAYEYQGKK